MPSAILLVSTAIGTEKAALRSLKKHEYVQEAYAVQSAYDIIVKVKAETFDKLSAAISKIKNLHKPQSVVTMLIVEDSTAQFIEKKNIGEK
jgi:hypothetical protein